MFVAATMSCKLVSHLVDGFIAGILQPEVDHGVLERSAHVELQRQIIHPLDMWKKNQRHSVSLHSL